MIYNDQVQNLSEESISIIFFSLLPFCVSIMGDTILYFAYIFVFCFMPTFPKTMYLNKCLWNGAHSLYLSLSSLLNLCSFPVLWLPMGQIYLTYMVSLLQVSSSIDN